MRLVCPNCGAHYAIDPRIIPEKGRDVQCSACSHTWFQAAPPASDRAVEPPAPKTPAERPIKRELDPEVMSVLREEAAREQAARAAERTPPEPTPEHPAAPETDPAPEPPVAPAPAAVTEVIPAPVPEPEPPTPEPQPEPAVAEAPAPVPEPRPSQQQTVMPEPVTPTIVPEPVSSVGRSSTSTGAPAHMRSSDDGVATADRPTNSETLLPFPPPQSAGLGGLAEARPMAAGAAAASLAELKVADESDPALRPTPRPDTANRGNLLPDIEEINSTLEASDQGKTAGDTGRREPPSARIARVRRGQGRRIGFIMAIALFALAAVLYVKGPEIGEMVPAFAPTLEAYGAKVQEGRIWLDGLFRQASTLVNG